MAASDESSASRSRWRRFVSSWQGRVVIALIALLILCWLFRYPLLRAAGDHLITEDPVAHADAVFVLGGSAMDRGSEAARLYAQGISDRFIFTGAPTNTDLQALGIDSTEAECTRNIAVRNGIPFRLTTALDKGTSTFEEAETLLALAQADHMDTVMIVSNRFHLRRVRFVFRERFRKAGIKLLLHGAPSTQFDERTWWTNEEGLIMLNNEYVKLAYYHLKY